jgi:hypothetical protein
MRVPILSNDPSFTHWGMARMLLDTDTLELELQDLVLVKTKKTTEKRARVSSDKLERAETLSAAFLKMARGVNAIFSEVPSGAQDANSANAFGIVVGILAAAPIPVTQVMPLETKEATGLGKNATKAEIIAWATEKYPHAGWLRERGNPNGRFIADNEHLADAIAVAEAGVLTDEFRRSLALMRRAA